MAEVHLKTLKLRVKDKHAPLLIRMAREVNTVFNFCNELSARSIQERQKWLSGYELQKYVAGYSKCDGVEILASTADAVCEAYASKRRQFRRRRLKWRVSNWKAPNRSLGWIPLKALGIRMKGGQLHYAGHHFGLWDSYGLADYKVRSGSFNQDARGRWYFNVVAEVPATTSTGRTAVGIDLGLKTSVTCSDGQRLEGRQFRAAESSLSKAQRAGKKRQVRTLHAKVRNQRKDAMHKLSTALVRQHGAIFVGDVSSVKLAKTTMAKSVYDAGWGQIKRMLEQKCHQAGVLFAVVNESYTTQTCHACGAISGPKGRAGLKKRVWACACGAVHDRDLNASLNIRARGLTSLEVGAGAVDAATGAVKLNQYSDSAVAPIGEGG